MIRVVVGDPASVSADAVVRPATEHLEPATTGYPNLESGLGTSLPAISHANEPGLGAAIVTAGGDLAAEFVIHAIVRAGSELLTPTVLRRALESCLQRAADWGLDVVAIPPLDLGSDGRVTSATAEVMCGTLIAHLKNLQHPSDVLIVVGTDEERDIFHQYLPGSVT